ncbi:kinase-like protein [Auriscalpium vulgare]|uniref:Kinase-like protein n=1 Tax=Auriscalpium vulgare TaxID=40419 RepID=A0ACB8RQY4_9AGAM|nr:kinase-like protein [Auriscalpium vulgare]
MGRYQFVEILGFGTFGVVYRAKDIVSIKDTQYAVKVLSRQQDDSPAASAQQQEWIINEMLGDHPNILHLYQVFFTPQSVFLIFDFCEGGDLLGAIVNRTFLWNDIAAKRACLQLVEATRYCHKKGVAHRDIKPENILVSGDSSELYLADFGLATTEKVCLRGQVGSRPFMSPECFGMSGVLSYDTRMCDVWSLGIVLVNMVYGIGLWHEPSNHDFHWCSFKNDPNYLIKSLPISKEANTLIKRMLTIDPEERITLPEVREELKKLKSFYLSADDVSVREISSVPAPARAPLKVVVEDFDPYAGAILRSVDAKDASFLAPTPTYPGPVPIPAVPELSHATLISTSATPSDILVTPETRPVPDSAAVAIAQSLSDLHSGDVAPVVEAKKNDSAVRKKFRDREAAFRNAVQKLAAYA